MKKVITYGTFDLFHNGHYNIIKRAKEYGDYLIVGVTSESYDIERGKLSVKDSLMKRIENVKNTGLVDEVIVEEYLGQKTKDIIKYDIDTFVIGSDWLGKFDHLKKICNVVYLERTKNISSTKIRNNPNNVFKIGIITNDMDDNGLVSETKYVSGLHIESVFSDKKGLASEFCKYFELNSSFDNLNRFFESIDIVYVKSDIKNRYEYVKKAILHKKGVICDTPLSLDKCQVKEVLDLSKKAKVPLIEILVPMYLRAFTQLIWMIEEGRIGDVLEIKGTVSYKTSEKKEILPYILMLSCILVIKILGLEYNQFNYKILKSENVAAMLTHLNFEYKTAVGTIEIGKNIELKNELSIVGSEGIITVDNKWWEMGYFELYNFQNDDIKKYSFNFEGNGIRYILQEVLIMLRDERYKPIRVFDDEILEAVDIINRIREDLWK